jgi:hypothetical protein
MPRVLLLHWNAEEAHERLEKLRRAGFDAESISESSPGIWSPVRANPPDAFVIDLSRMPSHGKAAAVFLQQGKTTKTVPLVFVGGIAEKVAPLQAVFAGSAFTAWPKVGAAIRKALRDGPAPPISKLPELVYSTSPLPKKLAIKPGATVLLMNAPDEFEEMVQPLPEGAQLTRRARQLAPMVLLFVESQADLSRDFGKATGFVADGGGLWLAWPKKTSGVVTDITGDFVRLWGLDRGWVDYKICSIDATWSGMLFARKKLK